MCISYLHLALAVMFTSCYMSAKVLENRNVQADSGIASLKTVFSFLCSPRNPKLKDCFLVTASILSKLLNEKSLFHLPSMPTCLSLHWHDTDPGFCKVIASKESVNSLWNIINAVSYLKTFTPVKHCKSLHLILRFQGGVVKMCFVL